MEFRQLEMFLAVVESGGFSQAGEHLHVSHSAIHRQIRLLEYELQDRLLVRVGNHMELTQTGGIVLEHARRIRQDLTNLRLQVEESTKAQTGHLRIGTGTTALVLFLPPILERYKNEFPGIAVHVMTGAADEVIQEIDNGNLDLGIVFSPMDVPKGERVPNYELLYQEEFVLAVAKGHPLAKRKTVSPNQLLDFPMIAYSRKSHLRRMLERFFENAGVTPRIIMELENEEAMEKMLEINMGIAVLSKHRAVMDKIHFFSIDGYPIYCDVGMVSPNIDYAPRAAIEFARMCRAASAVYPAMSR
ncbi:MAG: LysR family transcriptional regulator [Chloracidobacterium sp.]|nr:LysR family transcriptional regulator [Chloracidobacterium sp.]